MGQAIHIIKLLVEVQTSYLQVCREKCAMSELYVEYSTTHVVVVLVFSLKNHCVIQMRNAHVIWQWQPGRSAEYYSKFIHHVGRRNDCLGGLQRTGVTL